MRCIRGSVTNYGNIQVLKRGEGGHLRALHFLLKLLKLLVGGAAALLVHVLEGGEVPAVVVQALVVQVNDVRSHLIQEPSVMRHHHQRLLVPAGVEAAVSRCTLSEWASCCNLRI